MIQRFRYRTRKRKGALVAAKQPIMNCVNVLQLFNSLFENKLRFVYVGFKENDSSASTSTSTSTSFRYFIKFRVSNRRSLSVCSHATSRPDLSDSVCESQRRTLFFFYYRSISSLVFPPDHLILLFIFDPSTSLHRFQVSDFKYT